MVCPVAGNVRRGHLSGDRNHRIPGFLLLNPEMLCGMGSWVCCSAGLVNSSSDFRKGKARNFSSLLFVLQDGIQCLSVLPDSMGSLFPERLETDDLEQTELGFFLLQL